MRVTKRSGVPAGRFCSRLTQYETQTAAVASSGRSVLMQFHDAHVARARGISDASVCTYTSLEL